MMLGNPFRRNISGCCAALAVLLAGSAAAQDYASMGTSSVVAAAEALLKRGDYVNAIPALEEMIVRMKEMETPSGRETLQGTRYQIARAYLQTDRPEDAVNVLEVYLENEPRREERLVLRLLAQSCLETGDWDKVAEYAGRLLDQPGLDSDSTLTGNLLLGQAYFRQENYEACIRPLTYVTRNSRDPESVRVSHVMVASALVEMKKWGELFDLVRAIYRTDTKYDIVLNITLMNGGRSLFEEAEEKGLEEGRSDFINALFLYRLVLPRQELIAFATAKMDRLNTELARKLKTGIREMQKAEMQKEIDALRESIETLNGLPPYEDEVAFRIGQIYAEIKRYYEGYVLFEGLYANDPGSGMGQSSALQAALTLIDMGQTKRAEEHILDYLKKQPDGLYVRTMLSLIMREYLSTQQPEKLIPLRPHLDRLKRPEETNELALEADLHYMLAFAYLQAMEFGKAGERFDVVIERYPESSSVSDSIYYRGMSYMFVGDYENALNIFKTYQALGEYEDHYAASIFREGICLFGLGQIGEAEAVMSRFIDAYPKNPLVSEAYSMRGDIEAAKDGRDNPDTPDIDEYDPHTLDRALADYRRAIDSYYLPSQAAYAAFQAAAVYELEFKWQEIINLMNYYLDKAGTKADVAEAVYWIGRAQIELDQVDEAVIAYLDAIGDFGDDATQTGVDKVMAGLVTIANQYLDDTGRRDLADRIDRRMDGVEEGRDVLALRLRVVQAYLKSNEAAAELGSELLASGQDYADTTPTSLALMSDAAVTAGDTEQMGLIFDYFVEHFEGSDKLWHAFRAKTVQLMTDEDYHGVLAVVKEAQGLFGVEAYMGWAQLAKGNALYRLGELEEAEEAYNTIMGVPEWRGGLYAEAMLGMAGCRMGRRDYETAHSYYQRTYLLFKSYDNGIWAADGYLGAADCLVRLGRNEDAVNTLDEMLSDTYVNTLPQADTARQLKKKYGGA